MRLTQAVFLFIFVLLFSVQTALAAGTETAASHAILVDGATGTVLLDKNTNTKMPTSSMSKTMTMYMVFEALKSGHISLDDKFLISEKAWKMGGSKMFIEVDKRVSVEDLVRGVVVQSGNDAAVALAEGLGGTEEAFVEAMNIRAREIGMSNSNFKNASGWPDPEHYSTARDLAVLGYRIIHDFPEYYHYFAEREFTYNKIRQPNRDPLLGHFEGADGLKTGHTDAAGYGLIGSAVRDGRRLILVVNGLDSEKSRKTESMRLLEWGFRNFENRKIVSKGQHIDDARVWLGKKEFVPLVASRDIQVVLPVLKRKDVKLSVSYQEPLPAPIKKNDVLARLRIEIPEQDMVETDLVAGVSIPQDGIWGRAKGRFLYLLTGDYE